MRATKETSEKPILTSVLRILPQLVSAGYDKNHATERTQSMDIRTHLSTLQQDTRAYHTLGMGRHVWAVVHPEHRDEALLLERPSAAIAPDRYAGLVRHAALPSSKNDALPLPPVAPMRAQNTGSVQP